MTALTFLAVLVPGAGAAEATGERITSYQVDMHIGADAVVHVKETIAYDFGTTRRHGITRSIPYPCTPATSVTAVMTSPACV